MCCKCRKCGKNWLKKASKRGFQLGVFDLMYIVLCCLEQFMPKYGSCGTHLKILLDTTLFPKRNATLISIFLLVTLCHVNLLSGLHSITACRPTYLFLLIFSSRYIPHLSKYCVFWPEISKILVVKNDSG